MCVCNVICVLCEYVIYVLCVYVCHREKKVKKKCACGGGVGGWWQGSACHCSDTGDAQISS